MAGNSKRGKQAIFDMDRFNETAVEQLGSTVHDAQEVQEVPAAPVVPVVPSAPVEDDLSAYAAPTRTQGRKGQKAPRMNLAIPEDIYEYIRVESRRAGMTYSEFICAVMRQRRDNKN